MRYIHPPLITAPLRSRTKHQDGNPVARERIESGQPALHFGRYIDDPPPDREMIWDGDDYRPAGFAYTPDGDLYDTSRYWSNGIGDRGPSLDYDDPTDFGF